jgi:GT2 family glycosyltransferase
VRSHPLAELQPDGDLCADSVAGTAVLLRMDILRQVGFFDPRIFMFYEDDDLCLRVRASGFATVVVADAWVVHAGGVSSLSAGLDWTRPWHATWSRLYLETKYRGESEGQRRARWTLLRNLLKLSWPREFSNARRRIRRAAEVSAAWRFIKDRGYLREF